jgi:TusA-related sulfurtransferase
LNFLTATESLDVRGKTCPYPILETGASLRKLKTGEILEVLVDYMPSVRDGLPNFLEKYECRYEKAEVKSPGGDVYWRFLIKKSENLK